MPAYRDKRRGTWFASFYYTDWQGHRKLKKKRGFETKRDAKAFEEEFLRQSSRTCNMSFASMVEIYLEDMGPRLRETTMQNKRYLMEHHVMPFFKDLPVNEITPAHVRKWQSEILASGFAPTYAKTIHNQLLCFNGDAAGFMVLNRQADIDRRVKGAVVCLCWNLNGDLPTFPRHS